MNPEDVVVSMFDGIAAFVTSDKPTHLKLIRIIIFKGDQVSI